MLQGLFLVAYLCSANSDPPSHLGVNTLSSPGSLPWPSPACSMMHTSCTGPHSIFRAGQVLCLVDTSRMDSHGWLFRSYGSLLTFTSQPGEPFYDHSVEVALFPSVLSVTAIPYDRQRMILFLHGSFLHQTPSSHCSVPTGSSL